MCFFFRRDQEVQKGEERRQKKNILEGNDHDPGVMIDITVNTRTNGDLTGTEGITTGIRGITDQIGILTEEEMKKRKIRIDTETDPNTNSFM